MTNIDTGFNYSYIKDLYRVILSIREDWSDDILTQAKKDYALAICNYLVKDFENHIKRINYTTNVLSKRKAEGKYIKKNALEKLDKEKQNFTLFVKEFKQLYTAINNYIVGEDGRYFRDNYPFGYINMLERFDIKEIQYENSIE